jgi:hypothetical protein
VCGRRRHRWHAPLFIDKETIMEQRSAFRNATRRAWTGTGARRGKPRFAVAALPLASQ